MKNRSPQLEALRNFARYKTHGGYRWAAVTSDGALLCEPCVLENYRQIFAATRDNDHRSEWTVVGLTHSGESDSGESEHCAHCNKTLWSIE